MTRISASIDGGNVDVLSLYYDDKLALAQLSIRADPFTCGTDK